MFDLKIYLFIPSTIRINDHRSREQILLLIYRETEGWITLAFHKKRKKVWWSLALLKPRHRIITRYACLTLQPARLSLSSYSRALLKLIYIHCIHTMIYSSVLDPLQHSIVKGDSLKFPSNRIVNHQKVPVHSVINGQLFRHFVF